MRSGNTISDAEMKIMKLLWEKSPRTMPELTAALAPETGWSKHMVIALLKRMLEKGSIRVEESKPARLYYPIIEKESVEKAKTHKLLEELFHGKARYLVSAMVEQGDLSGEDIDELIDYLEKVKEGE